MAGIIHTATTIDIISIAFIEMVIGNIIEKSQCV